MFASQSTGENAMVKKGDKYRFVYAGIEDYNLTKGKVYVVQSVNRQSTVGIERDTGIQTNWSYACFDGTNTRYWEKVSSKKRCLPEWW